MTRKIEKVTVDRNESRLQEDLEKYRQKALEMGATHAVIIQTDDITTT